MAMKNIGKKSLVLISAGKAPQPFPSTTPTATPRANKDEDEPTMGELIHNANKAVLDLSQHLEELIEMLESNSTS